MLNTKTALVTGSTSGIGLAIAKALAGQGANIMLSGFGEEAEIEEARAGLEGGRAPIPAQSAVAGDVVALAVERQGVEELPGLEDQLARHQGRTRQRRQKRDALCGGLHFNDMIHAVRSATSCALRVYAKLAGMP